MTNEELQEMTNNLRKKQGESDGENSDGGGDDDKDGKSPKKRK
jgi:hypothetical protein